MFSIFLLYLVCTLLLILSVLVLIKNYKNKINVYFSLTTLVLAAWFLVIFYEDLVGLDSALLMVDIDFSLSGILATLFCFLFINFPYRTVGKSWDKLIFSVGAFMAAIPFTGLVVSSVSENSAGGISYEVGPLFIPFMFLLLALVAVAILSLFRKFRSSKGVQRQQIEYVLAGFGITAIINLLVVGILPRFFSLSPDITRIGIYSSIITISAMSYAIVKHKLMDIRLVAARSLAYIVLVVVLAGFYAGAVLGIESLLFPNQGELNLMQGAIRTFLAVVMAFSFQPLRRWITKATDRFFFKNQYDPEQLLDTLSHTIGATIILIELMYKVLELLKKEMKITRGIFVVLSNTGKIYNFQTVGYKDSIDLREEDIVRLAKDGVLIADDLEEKSRYKQLLRKYDVSASVPIKTDNDTQGVLLLGEKASGDMFSQNDMKVFSIMAPELAVAINNAKSFEKIEKFNITLRQEIKKATHELETKNEQLRELDKAKDEFISMASHQLRTPLTAIKGYLSMLLEGDAGEIKVSQYDFVNEAFSGANRMVGLINDLLNVSRMETGRFFLEPVELDMEKVVAEEVKQLSNHAKDKKLKLTFKVKGKTPKVMADETKIRQVMMNFIDNAVYYTTEGEVEVTLEHDKKDVIFQVKDTGIGVPKAQQKNLFTKFYRADNARHVRPDGTGLGIYLAKRVMDDHGGELIFHSVEGKGSTFGFKLPIKSKIKMQRVSAPTPACPVTPAIGELAAGACINPTELANGNIEHGPTVSPGSPIATGDVIASKAAGIEPPLGK